MIPKRPFVGDFSESEEIARFDALKPRLLEVWDLLMQRDEEPHTSVVVPSMTLDQEELRKIPGAVYYEERLLFLLIRLRNPKARVVFVTSTPLHPMILEYYFELLAGTPASHARSRLTVLCAHDASPRSLTEKILERPRLIERIRAGVPDPSRAYLTVFNSTPLERRLAVLLGIPLNGVDPRLCHLGSKSGSRKIFREAGVPLPEGFEDLRTLSDVVQALVELRRLRPGLRRAVVKLDDSFSGEGNAIFNYPEEVAAESVSAALHDLEFSVGTENRASYFDKFERMGGIVEEFIEGREKSSPSVQMRITPHGRVELISSHDQILGGARQQVFLGCTFPARQEYRVDIQRLAVRVGEALAAHGVVSRLGVDFLAWRDAPDEAWRLAALEINLRMGGTTHPYLALRFLTGGDLDAETGLFHAPGGHTLGYRATDNLSSANYRGLLPDDLIDILTYNRLHYNHRKETGAIFHMIGAASEFGKLGLTVIGKDRREIDRLYSRTLEILDRETSWGRGGHGRSA